MSDLLTYKLGLVGGIQDSQAEGDPKNYVRLENWTTFRGRFALRAPVFLTTTLTSSDANVTRALAGAYHDGKLWLAVFRDANDDVRLWELTTAGVFTADRGAIWTGITGAVPRPVMASFEGGSATGGTKRLYICDYDEQQVTKFWNGTSIASLQVDFDNSGTPEDVKFHYVFPYQFHLWGAGFFQGTTSRKEMLRFSQPGLIPSTDPDTADIAEWFAADFRPVGRRGDKITNIGTTGGPMIVFKDRQCFALFGYDSQSWAIRQLSERAGAAGPYASASTGDGLCFFWSERGPHVTDGQRVTDLSESIRKHVLEAEVSDKNVVGFSPDDGLVYFLYQTGGATEPNRWLAFDQERKLMTEGEGFAVGGGLLRVKHVIIVPSIALPGPIGAPSGLVQNGFDNDEITLSWTNGDIALDTETEVYRDLASPATTLLATKTSGIQEHRDFPLTAKTTYFYRVRHLRNTQFSAFSNEISQKTALANPIDPSAIRLSNGVRFTFTNNANLADIVIERKKTSDTGWGVLTTLLAQGTGVINHDDTTATCGISFDYRAKATQAGETDSPYTDPIVSSVACAPPSLTAASHVLTLQTYCGFSPQGPTYATVSWTGTNLLSVHRAKIYRNVAGGGFVQVNDVEATRLSVADLWAVKSGSTQKTLQYRVDLVENGVVVSTQTTTQTAPFVDNCI